MSTHSLPLQHMYIRIYIYIYSVYIYIYMYIERDRERYILFSLSLYIYIYIYIYIHLILYYTKTRAMRVHAMESAAHVALLPSGKLARKICMFLGTPNPPTKSSGFRGFDSSILLILRGGNSHVR